MQLFLALLPLLFHVMDARDITDDPMVRPKYISPINPLLLSSSTILISIPISNILGTNTAHNFIQMLEFFSWRWIK